MESQSSAFATEPGNPYSSDAPPDGSPERLAYETLLAFAGQRLSGQGPSVPLDEIARAAGVDSSTLRQWFPTREHLIVAVSERHIQQIGEKGAELSNSLPPGDAVVEWIRFLITQITSRRELVAAMFTLQAESGAMFECNLKIAEIASGLLDRAKAAGALRSDLEPRDVAKLIAAVAFATQSDAADEAERFMGLALGGLQPNLVSWRSERTGFNQSDG